MQAQKKFTPQSLKVLFLGDSITKRYTSPLTASQFYPSQVQINSKAANVKVRSINAGNSGFTTTQLLAITDAALQRYTPDVLVFFAGVNDPGAAIPGATTQSNIQSVIDKALTATTAYPNVCKSVIVSNTVYNNFTAGSLDNIATQTFYATNVTLRGFQSAAATYGVNTYGGDKVVYADLFGYIGQLILGGIIAQGDWAALHVADQNQHPNSAGCARYGTFFTQVIASLQKGTLIDPYRIR